MQTHSCLSVHHNLTCQAVRAFCLAAGKAPSDPLLSIPPTFHASGPLVGVRRPTIQSRCHRHISLKSTGLPAKICASELGPFEIGPFHVKSTAPLASNIGQFHLKSTGPLAL